MIFREYDIRGIYPKEVNEDLAYKLGKIFAFSVKEKAIIVGRDGRKGSPSMHESFKNGVKALGKDVIDLGLCTTPMFHFAVQKLSLPGAMITASHNPKQFNGFKFSKAGGVPFPPKKFEFLLKKSIKEKRKIGFEQKINILSSYAKFIKKFLNKDIENLKILIDFGNGAANLVSEIFEDLPIEIISINNEIDPNFKGRGPDPIAGLKKLGRLIKKEKANFGIAYDGDGDRLLFLDELGNFIKAEAIAAIIANKILRRRQKAVYSIDCSRIFEEAIALKKCKATPCGVGLMPVFKAMRAEKAILGVETSGHYYFKSFGYLDNPEIALMQIINIISKAKAPLSELVGPYKRYVSKVLDLQSKNPQKAIRRVEERFKKLKPSRIFHVDGIYIEFKDFWFNLRQSKTEDRLLRLRIEGKTSEAVERAFEKIIELL